MHKKWVTLIINMLVNLFWLMTINKSLNIDGYIKKNIIQLKIKNKCFLYYFYNIMIYWFCFILKKMFEKSYPKISFCLKIVLRPWKFGINQKMIYSTLLFVLHTKTNILNSTFKPLILSDYMYWFVLEINFKHFFKSMIFKNIFFSNSSQFLK